MLCCLNLPIRLLLSVSNDGLDVLLLELNLGLHFSHHAVNVVDRVLQCLVLSAHSVTQRLLQLVQVIEDVFVHDSVGVSASLLLSLEDVLYRLELLCHLYQTWVLVRIDSRIHLFKYNRTRTYGVLGFWGFGGGEPISFQ